MIMNIKQEIDRYMCAFVMSLQLSGGATGGRLWLREIPMPPWRLLEEKFPNMLLPYIVYYSMQMALDVLYGHP